MSRDFLPVPGGWHDWPLWRKGLAMATLRPYCMARGYVAVAKQLWALRFPGKPFRPQAWVHWEPCPAEWCDGHDESHLGADDCVPDRWEHHGLEYERDMDVVRSVADDFDWRVKRTYTWSRPGDDE